MNAIDNLDILFIVFGLLFQIVLIIHFAFRRWAFHIAKQYGPFVYALGIPAFLLSLAQIAAGKPWSLWLGGVLFLVWGIYGYYVEYVRQIEWRDPPYWPVFGPYLTLYLATIMFYWWPLWDLARPLWYVYTVLFVIATILNLASHHPVDKDRPQVA
jgi:hypothetical protein